MQLALDLDFVRRQFPALSNGWVFLDNAGGSQTLRSVIERTSEYLLGSMVAHGAPTAPSRLAEERLRHAAARFATLLNAGDASEVVMGGSTTQLLQNLGLGMAPNLAANDEIIVSDAEHHSNVEPWLRLAQQRGVVLRTWTVNRQSWRLEDDDLRRLLSDRTRLVAVTQCSNLLGTIHDVAALAKLVHAHGAELLVDGVAFAPHRAIDVRGWDVDYYLMSTYKVYGPHHAVLYGKRERLLKLHGTNHSFIPADAIPYKMQPGNANCELSHGATAVVDYLEELGAPGASDAPVDARGRITRAFDAIAAHEERLAQRLFDGLASVPRVRVLGSTTPDRAVRVPTVSLVVEGMPSRTVVEQLAAAQLCARSGDFYARSLAAVLALGPYGGAVRVSLVHYNTLEEVDRLLAALERIAAGRG